MKVAMVVDSDLKTVRIEKDAQLGSRFSCVFAEDLFKLEDAGYELIGTSKKINKKLHNMRVAFYRVK